MYFPGITEKNLADVSWCVQTPKLEKMARLAASQLFHKLNPMKGGVMCKEDFLKSLDTVVTSKSERKLLEKTGECGCLSDIVESA